MKWKLADIEQLQKQKEYVDSAVLPLFPLDFSQHMTTSCEAVEYSDALAVELEKQLRGRLLLLPPFTYLKSETLDERRKRLFAWQKEIESGGIRYLFLLTSDVDWKKIENQLQAPLIWLAPIPLKDMDVEYKNEILSRPITHVLEIVTNCWQNRHNCE